MNSETRFYDTMLREHFGSNRQMAFISGPRQVGKTTTGRALADHYLNWDNHEHREVILAGPQAVAQHIGLDALQASPPVLLFDELHKYERWKDFLKGFYDTYQNDVRVMVTGSSRLDVYKRIGDSLMGRYFIYRMHPFSVAETLTRELPDQGRILREAQQPDEGEMAALWEFGGFPEPFLRRDARFSRRWQNLRVQQLTTEDLREQTQVQQLGQLEILVKLLGGRSGQQLVYSALSNEIRVSVDTIRRWIDILTTMHFGFTIRPWYENLSRSLRKEPKWFLRDWSGIADKGARAETFVACHLLKAVEGWTDLGLGEFGLHYLRDKDKREVDFLISRDGKPWFLVEAKYSDTKLSPHLAYYQEATGAPLAFQVVVEADYVNADPFTKPGRPLVVPARTLLSQLV